MVLNQIQLEHGRVIREYMVKKIYSRALFVHFNFGNWILWDILFFLFYDYLLEFITITKRTLNERTLKKKQIVTQKTNIMIIIVLL